MASAILHIRTREQDISMFLHDACDLPVVTASLNMIHVGSRAVLRPSSQTRAHQHDNPPKVFSFPWHKLSFSLLSITSRTILL